MIYSMMPQVESMAQRTFFSLRYALPRYTFILMSILVLFPVLTRIFAQSDSVTLIGSFLAFLYLLSGAAIGFLVSQVWYVVFNSRLFEEKILCKFYFRDMKIFLESNYGRFSDCSHMLLFSDYVHRLSNEKIQLYTQRLWDLIHTFGSTITALILGSLFGLVVRNGWFDPQTPLDIGALLEKIAQFCASTPKFETCMHAEMKMSDIGVILIILALFCLLCQGLLHALKNHAEGTYTSVREVVNLGKLPCWKAREVFSKEYFEKNGRRPEY